MAVNVVVSGGGDGFGPVVPDEVIAYPQADDFEVVVDDKGYNPFAYILREGKRIAYVVRPLRIEIIQEVA